MIDKIAHASIILCFLGLGITVSATPSAHVHNEVQNESLCCKKGNSQTILTTQVIASGLEFPWALSFLPNGDLLVTERVGRLRIVRDGKILAPVMGVPRVASVGQGGLLDLALHPEFKKNNLIYISFSEYDKNNNNTMSTAVARAVLMHQGDTQYVLTNIKIIFSASKKSSGGKHFGSRLAFAKDGTLFVTLGERGESFRAQDLLDHAGSVIRIHSDGSIPKDNPFLNGNTAKALPEIFSIGHRNAQGATIHPKTGDLWIVGHGPKGGDEVNVVKSGRNYGWPIISYGRHYSGERVGEGTHAHGYEQPIYYWDPSIAPSGLVFYNPKHLAIPEWKDSLLLGALKHQMLVRLVLDGNTIVKEEHYFKNTFGRIRDVRVGPHGAVWLLTDAKNGKIIRVNAP